MDELNLDDDKNKERLRTGDDADVGDAKLCTDDEAELPDTPEEELSSDDEGTAIDLDATDDEMGS